MTIEISNAPASLKDKITDLCRETYEAHRRASPSDWPGNFFEPFIRPMIEAAFRNKKGRALKESPSLFVAQMDGALAGYYRLSHFPTDPSRDYFTVEIQDIYVLPDYRRRGVARAMIAHAKALAKTHDWDKLEASVAEWNTWSRSLFEQQEFVTHSRKLSFGPDRAARDVPMPRSSLAVRAINWAWIAIAAVLLVLFLRQLSG